MAQISNMSANENTGFKSEYHVRIVFFFFKLLLPYLFALCMFIFEFLLEKIHLAILIKI